MKKYAFGVDIGGTTCKIGFFETGGKLLDRFEIPTNTANQGAAILDDIAKAIDEKLMQEQVSKDDVQGIGVGVPGPVKSNGIVNRCVNLGWGVFSVEEELQAKTGLPVKAGNDANVAALGEMWQGSGKGCNDVVMTTLGTGVGGAVIINGKIVSGFHGAGGEFGHMAVNPDETEPCTCGKYGCLEQYASATGIARLAKKKLSETQQKTSLSSYDTLTAKEIFDAAKEKDAVALELVEEIGQILGRVLANVACVVNPEIILIGGGVSKAGDILVETVQKYFAENVFHACRDAKFALAGLGNDAGMYGCVKLLL